MGQAVLVEVQPQWSRLGAAAADQRRWRRGSGPSAVARRAQPGAAAPDQPGKWAATTVGVLGQTETLPIMGQAVLGDVH
jgi:hypothetical protein